MTGLAAADVIGGPAPAAHPAAMARGAPVALVLLALLAYANALANGFVLDDGGIIVRNPLVTEPWTAWRAFGLPYWPADTVGGQYRPLAILSFALDWALSGGDPRWFHLVNLLWHAAATVLAWALARELFAPAAAVLAGALFAVHPVHVEAVANTVGRLECMSAVFVLAALLAHRRGSRWAAALFPLALLSKENAIVFLGLAVASDLLVAEDRPAAALRERRALYAAYAITVVAYAALLLAVFAGRPLAVRTMTLDGAPLDARLLTVATVVVHWARLLVAPLDLSADYEPQVLPLATAVGPMVVLGIALVAALLGGAAAAWRREPRLAFALLWIPITLAPVSNVLFVSGVTLAERTLYLPSVGICLAAACLLERAPITRKPLVVALLASVALAFAARTWTRTPVWRDNRTLVIDLLAAHPESYRAHFVAGRVHRAVGRLDEAARELEIARRIFPRDPSIHEEAAELALQRRRLGEAALLLDSAVALRPSDPELVSRRAEVRRVHADSLRAVGLLAASPVAVGAPTP